MNGREMVKDVVLKGAIGLLWLFLAMPAWAQQKGSIELTSAATKEVVTTNAQGQKEVKKLPIPGARVVPGDVVIYTTGYKNIGKKPVENVVITNPVPEHMDYIGGSAEGKGAQIDFSTDKGWTYATPEKLTATDSRGNKRKARARDYTTIRWVLTKPVPPGGAGTVSFKARLQ